MGGLILVLPVLAFDVWLSVTTGQRVIKRWISQGQWRFIAAAAAIGLLLAVWLTFFSHYSWGKEEKVVGFPIPHIFYALQDKAWVRTTLSGFMGCLGTAADFLTGLAAPFIPFKVAEFLKTVKAELK
jgi:hypothetical protein